ncbi:MAG TPA: TVP38/TMEM64 family protein [Gemmataceae bacterium]|nr:TVP38/TMEM64 family protein [Gemmataceae bacterium]
MFRRVNEILHGYARLLRLGSVLLILLSVLLFVKSLPIDQPLRWLTDRIQGLGAWGPLLFVLLYVAVTMLPFPGTPVTLAAGAVFGPILATVIISLASTLSAALWFLLARYLAHDKVARKIEQFPRLRALYRAVGREGGWKIVMAIRLSHAMPYGIQNVLLGLTPIRFVPFLLATVASMLPGTVLFSWVGSLGASALEGAELGGGWVVRLAVIVAAVLAMIYVVHVARKAIKEKTGIDLEKDDPLEHPEPLSTPQADMPQPHQGWAWDVIGLLLVALLLLVGAIWSYAERDAIRQAVEQWFR